MKPLRGIMMAAAVGLIACSDGPTSTKGTAPQPQLSALNLEVGPESALVSMTANMMVYWSVEYGETSAYGRTTAEVGPATELNEVLTGLVPLRTYYYKVWARQGTTRVGLTGDLATPDYEPCDARNTTAKKVDVTVTYAPPNPDPFVVMEGVELLDCAGNLLTGVGDKMASLDNGVTYGRDDWRIRVNYPTGSQPHSFRAIRVNYFGGVHYDGWAEGADIRVNGVPLTRHSESLPPPFGGCAGCEPGVRWYFSMDSLGVAHP